MKTSLVRSLLVAAGLALGSLSASAAMAPSEATVLKITGTATVTMSDGAAPRALQVGDKLPQGATITTGAGAVVQLQPFAGAVSTINENTSVGLDKLTLDTDSGGKVTKQTALLKLKSGNVVSTLDPGNKGINDYGVSTPKGVAAARGTAFTTVVTATNGVTISANADTVQFTDSTGATVSISHGFVIVTSATGVVQPAVSLASLATSTSPEAAAAKAAIQAGVEAMAQVAAGGLGGLTPAATSDLASQVISVSNVANPNDSVANTTAIVGALSAGGQSTETIAAVTQAAVTAAPTLAAAIAGSAAGAVTAAQAVGVLAGAQAGAPDQKADILARVSQTTGRNPVTLQAAADAVPITTTTPTTPAAATAFPSQNNNNHESTTVQ